MGLSWKQNGVIVQGPEFRLITQFQLANAWRMDAADG